MASVVTVQCPTCRSMMSVPVSGGTFQCPNCRNPLSVAPQGPSTIPASRDPYALFAAVDTDRSGQVTADELSSALSNGGMRFDIKACRLMIAMFDADRSGTISPPEFAGLWDYLQKWRASFSAFDVDRNGTISHSELSQILATMGYRFSPQMVNIIVSSYDTDKNGSIGFDEYILVNCELQILNSYFQSMDPARTGKVTVDLEGFLKVAFALKR